MQIRFFFFINAFQNLNYIYDLSRKVTLKLIGESWYPAKEKLRSFFCPKVYIGGCSIVLVSTGPRVEGGGCWGDIPPSNIECPILRGGGILIQPQDDLLGGGIFPLKHRMSNNTATKWPIDPCRKQFMQFKL